MSYTWAVFIFKGKADISLFGICGCCKDREKWKGNFDYIRENQKWQLWRSKEVNNRERRKLVP